VTGRALLRLGLLLLGLGSLFLPLLDDPPLQSGAYVQDVREHSAVIAMVTATPEMLRAEVRAADGGAAATVDVENAAVRRHRFHTIGLLAASRYAYRVLDGGGAVRDEGSFRTPPAADGSGDREPVRFCALGDSGDQPWWVWLQTAPLFYWPARWQWLPTASLPRRVGEQIAAAAPQFVLHLGDIVYPWGKAAHYSPGFFRPFAAALRTAPFYVTLGNHDVKDDDGRQALANFALPTDSGTGDGRCYSFAWGSARVIVLDLNTQSGREDEPARSDLPANIDEKHPAVLFLRHELQDELQAAHEPWLIVASHFPIRSESRAGTRDDLLQYVAPLLREHGVDLYLSGHDHTYQRYTVEGETTLVVSGGGGKSVYKFENRHDEVRAVVKHSLFHWCQVDITGMRLHLEAHGVDGARLDAFDLVHDDAWLARVPALDARRRGRILATRR
jgi:hypothetical protein